MAGNASRIAKAARRFARFSGHKANSATRVPYAVPREALAIGNVLAIEYETVRDGEYEKYRHIFRKRSRPLLASAFHGKQLLLIGGKYLFTERGIVDK